MAARIMLLDTEWDRSCQACRRWHFNPDGTLLKRRGKPIPRDERAEPPPCWQCPKVPAAVREAKRVKGEEVTPADATDPCDTAREVVRFFAECEAVGQFPDDPIVRRHAAIIRPFARAAEQGPINLLLAALARRGS